MRLLLLFILVTIIISCKKNATQLYDGIAQVKVPARIVLDTSYGSNTTQTIDLYLPKGRLNTSTVLIALIHDGQWTNGDKQQMQTVMQTLKVQLPQFAFALINYRLVTNNQSLFPTQEQDVTAAIQFLKQAGDSLGYKYITLFGEGAGGHLSLLSAFKLGKPTISAVAAINSPIDLVDIYNSQYNTDLVNLLQSVTGTTPPSSNILFQSSPINFIQTSSPPVYYIHGQSNNIISPQQGVSLINKLNQYSVSAQLTLLPNEPHRLSNEAFSKSITSVAQFFNNRILYR